MFSSVVVAQVHLYFLASQITHNTLLLFHETHNALHVCFLLLLVFLPALSETLANSWQKKYFIDYRTANAIHLFVPVKRKFSSFSK